MTAPASPNLSLKLSPETMQQLDDLQRRYGLKKVQSISRAVDEMYARLTGTPPIYEPLPSLKIPVREP